MLKMVNLGIVNAFSIFESQISSEKQDKEIEVVWFVSKAEILLLFTCVLYWYKMQLNSAFFCL